MAPFSSASAFLQPSRAWSKNGLLVFLGTRANTYFLVWASAAPAMPRTAAAAIVAPRSFPIMAFPPSQVSTDESMRSVGAASADPFEQDRENNEGTDEGALPIGIDAGHQQAVADDLDQRGADQG